MYCSIANARPADKGQKQRKVHGGKDIKAKGGKMKGKRRKAKGKKAKGERQKGESNEDGSFTAFRMTRSGGRRQGAMVSTEQARDGVYALCCRQGAGRRRQGGLGVRTMLPRGCVASTLCCCQGGDAGKGRWCPRRRQGDGVPALCCREGVWRLHYAVARAGMQARGDGVHGAGKGRGVRAMLRGRWEKADSASAEDIKAHPKSGPKVALWMC